MKRFFISVTIVFSVLFVLITQYVPPSKDFSSIVIGNTEVVAEILDSQSERVQGLSGREFLVEDHVLLFVFEREGLHGIWMKDMNFPIDIIWLDTDLRIVHIEQAVSPQSYPTVFYPPTNSLYVIETVSNFVSKHKIKIGDRVHI